MSSIDGPLLMQNFGLSDMSCNTQKICIIFGSLKKFVAEIYLSFPVENDTTNWGKLGLVHVVSK